MPVLKTPKNARGLTMNVNGRAYCYTLQTFRSWGAAFSNGHSPRPATVKAWLHRYENGRKAGLAILVGGVDAAIHHGQAWLKGGAL